MTQSQLIAKHFREVYFGGNWTYSNFRENIEDLSWEEAITKVYNLNTIAVLVNHMNYYVSSVLRVLQGEALVSKDEESFTHPPIHSQADWEKMLNTGWENAELFASLVEKLPDERLQETFTDEKYGIYYRNLHGIIEHTHYHLGQIAVIKKIIRVNK